jgi:DEAD/DEAH box helicase domain-containing protein
MSRNAAPDPIAPIHSIGPPPPPSPPAALAAVLAACREGRLGRQLVHAAYLPAAPPRYGELDPPLAPELCRALAQGGVTRLFSHQVEGIAAVRRGESVLLTTPTASGKSLVFQVPPLEEAARGGPGRALYLFPLKALGQDQRGKLQRLAEAAGLPPEVAGCAIYDGDTPRAEREAIRRSFPRVVISNPDMLHLGVLGAWTGWGPFLADLRWIVLDELHTYRGIFGSHFHHVLARFLRLCRAVGADPAVIASSATAANAGDFAAALTGRRMVEVAASGAPREGRHLLLFRPDGSPYTTALQLLTACLQAGLKTIVFTKARRITELLYSWLQRGEPELARRVASYRAGFLPEERRGIERDLSTGRLDGVISTSALELGIDIGGLDACILVGYPGSMMATWQRSGRVGRAGRESLTAMVALPDALDQYLLDHPDEFLGRPCERLIVDPGNEPVARAHLVCAAAELPLSRGGDRPYLERHAATVGDLLREAKLLEVAEGDELVSPRRRPQRDINLRGSGRTYAIEDVGRARLMGTVDGVRVFHECHPGAVYLHAGRQFLVEELRIDERRVRARAADVDYFTTPLTEKETEILAVLKERRDGPHGSLRARLCELKVTERVVGFQRKRIQGQEVIDQQALDLPPSEWETVGVVWEAPRAVQETLAREGEHFMGALHASEHAAISLVPLLALCDRGDLGGISMPFHPQVGCGCVFLYDGHPGGVGIAARAFEDLPELLSRVLDLLNGCPCDDGCPSCVQSPKCGNGNRPLDKAGAARVLRLLLGREEPAVEWSESEPVEAIPRVVEEGEEESSPDRPAPAQGFKSSGREKRWAKGDGSPDRPRPLALPGIERSAPPAREDSPGPSISGRSRRRQRGGWRGVEGSHISRGAGRDRSESERRSPASTDMGYHAVTGPAAGSISAPYPPLRPSAKPTGLARALRVPGLASLLGWLRARIPGARPAAVPRGGTVLFDLETIRSAAEVGGWGNSHRMGISLGVVYHLEHERFEVFPESRVQELHDLLRAADLVVGFNIRRFDYAVLGGYTGEDYARTLPTLDLLDEVRARLGFRLGLNHLARETLGTAKSGDGLQCLEWVREGRMDLVESYCRKDVEILRDLFLHGRREGCVYYRDRAGDRKLRLPVAW